MISLLTILKYLVASIIVLAVSGAAYQQIATKRDQIKYPAIGKMVDIGGYKLHMIDSGAGGPTVVMDAGGGCDSLDWSLVQPEIAKFTRVIAYDRAGHAWSDASPFERTSENIAKELHAMLHAAYVPVPYILVGHSLGGINVRMFASMYPDEVAGIVLVDTSHEEQIEKLSNYMPMPSSFFFRAVQVAAYLGVYRIPQAQKTLGIKTEKFSLEIQKMYPAQKIATKNIKATVCEMFDLRRSFNQLRSVDTTLGNKPLTVITAGISLSDQCPGRFSPEQAEQVHKILAELQADLVSKSSRGKRIVAKNSGHMINYDQPEIVVEAVREMVDELKS